MKWKIEASFRHWLRRLPRCVCGEVPYLVDQTVIGKILLQCPRGCRTAKVIAVLDRPLAVLDPGELFDQLESAWVDSVDPHRMD